MAVVTGACLLIPLIRAWPEPARTSASSAGLVLIGVVVAALVACDGSRGGGHRSRPAADRDAGGRVARALAPRIDRCLRIPPAESSRPFGAAGAPGWLREGPGRSRRGGRRRPGQRGSGPTGGRAGAARVTIGGGSTQRGSGPRQGSGPARPSTGGCGTHRWRGAPRTGAPRTGDPRTGAPRTGAPSARPTRNAGTPRAADPHRSTGGDRGRRPPGRTAGRPGARGPAREAVPGSAPRRRAPPAEPGQEVGQRGAPGGARGGAT